MIDACQTGHRADLEELARGFKLVVEEERRVATQPPVTETELTERLGFEREGLRRDHYRRRDGELHSSVIMARLFPEAY